jgi:YYY domain-containing protein
VRESLIVKRAFWPLVIVCAVFGLTLRVWNLDFDQRQHLHPDERFLALTSDAMSRAPVPAAHGTFIGPVLDWLDGQRSPANPYDATESFVYGPLPLTLARSTSAWLHEGVADGAQPADAVAHALDAIGIPLIDDAGAPRFDANYGVDLVGRLNGAVFDTITIVVIALIGRRLGGRTAGVAAAGLYAVSVLAIQHAHFLGAEPLLGLACALTVLCALRLDRGDDVGRAINTGLLTGLAGGLAVAVKLTGASLLAVVGVGCAALLYRHRRRSDVVRLAAVVVGAVAAFRFFDPSAFNGLGMSLAKPFTDDLARARELKNSTAPPSFQWADRPLIVQPVIWLGVFTVGPGATLAACAGAVAIAAKLVGRRLGATARSLMTDVGRWPIAVIVGATVVPFAHISLTSFPTGRYYFPMLPALYATAGLGVAAAVRLAARSTGRTRNAATAITVVSAGLALVWGVGFVNGVYAQTNTRIEASRWIAANIPAGSVISSQAWDDGLPMRLPDLDADQFVGEQLNMVGPDDEIKVATIAEQLGRLDYVIESSPRIWGTVTRLPQRFPSTINFFDGLDSGALGFERVATFRTGISLGPWRLDDTSADEAFSIYDHPQVRIWRKVRDVDRDQIVAVLDPIAASNAVPVQAPGASANGLILHQSEIATNAAGPTYDQAFDTNGSDVGHALAWFVLLEVLGLAAFALFAPMLLRLPDAGLGMAKVVALGSLAGALFVTTAWLHIDLDRRSVGAVTTLFVAAGAVCGSRRRALLTGLWRERRRVLMTAEILGAAMFAVFVLTRAMNPDLWHPERGGEKPFEMALLTAVLRTKTLPVYDPWYSHGALNYYYGGWFLLSAPARILRTSPAMVMNVAIGVFASCTSGAAFSLGAGMVNATRRRWRRNSRTQQTAIRAGLLAAVFVLLVGNGAILRPMWRWIGGSAAPGERVDWWGLSRVIPGSVAITEFPAWSLLFGDVHPHLMGIGVLLAVGTLCIAWYAALTEGRRVHALVLAICIGVGIGLIRMTNTWDFPLGLGVALSTLIAAALRVRWRRLVAPAAALLFVVVVVWSPYVRRGEVFDSGFDPAILRTPPSSWLKQFGLFAAITVMVVLMHLSAAFRASRTVWGWITRAHLVVVGLSLLALAYLAVRPGFEVFEITASLTIACLWVCWQRQQTRSVGGASRLAPLGGFVTAIGWAIQAGVELFTVRNDGGRMNTVFKFWYGSWIVLGVGCAVLVAEQLRSRDMWVRRTSTVLVAAALAIGVGFWSLATPVRMDDRLSDGGLSLDGQAYLSDDFVFGGGEDGFVPADDLALVDWIRANVHGIQVVAEAPGDDYKWTGRVSWLTGLPTPIGWSYHESQQRRPYGASIEARRTDMTSLYTTIDPSVMAQVLSRYSVAYVVFGTQEQLLSSDQSAETLRSFECLRVMTSADRSTETGAVPDQLFVAAVDQACVIRLRPPLAPPPPST